MPRPSFASLSPERRRDVAASGGRASQRSPRAHHLTREERSRGGKASGPANAARYVEEGPDRRAFMAEIGAMGGKATAANAEHMFKIQRAGGRKTWRNALLWRGIRRELRATLGPPVVLWQEAGRERGWWP